MLVETNLRAVPLAEVQREAREAEALGFDALTMAEIRQDPFLAIALMAAATERVELATGVAIAFPRSPMTVAYGSRNLQDLANGRFSLGLGTQVKAHVERRFGARWGAPGPHLREYVLALRAIWDCWHLGTPLDFRGEYYSFTLMTPEFNLGPTPHRMRVHLAAVNPYNTQLAGELAEALRVHGFCTPEYLRDVIWPNVRVGVERAGRSLDDFEVIGCGFIATGPDDESVEAERERIRHRVAFYGSTRAYRPVLEHHGWGELADKLHKLVREQRWEELSGAVSDEVLDTFCMAGRYEVIADAVGRRLGGLVDRVAVPVPESVERGRDRLTEALAAMKQVPTARQRAHARG